MLQKMELGGQFFNKTYRHLHWHAKIWRKSSNKNFIHWRLGSWNHTEVHLGWNAGVQIVWWVNLTDYFWLIFVFNFTTTLKINSFDTLPLNMELSHYIDLAMMPGLPILVHFINSGPYLNNKWGSVQLFEVSEPFEPYAGSEMLIRYVHN